MMDLTFRILKMVIIMHLLTKQTFYCGPHRNNFFMGCLYVCRKITWCAVRMLACAVKLLSVWQDRN